MLSREWRGKWLMCLRSDGRKAWIISGSFLCSAICGVIMPMRFVMFCKVAHSHALIKWTAGVSLCDTSMARSEMSSSIVNVSAPVVGRHDGASVPLCFTPALRTISISNSNRRNRDHGRCLELPAKVRIYLSESWTVQTVKRVPSWYRWRRCTNQMIAMHSLCVLLYRRLASFNDQDRYSIGANFSSRCFCKTARPTWT